MSLSIYSNPGFSMYNSNFHVKGGNSEEKLSTTPLISLQLNINLMEIRIRETWLYALCVPNLHGQKYLSSSQLLTLYVLKIIFHIKSLFLRLWDDRE